MFDIIPLSTNNSSLAETLHRLDSVESKQRKNLGIFHPNYQLFQPNNFSGKSDDLQIKYPSLVSDLDRAIPISLPKIAQSTAGASKTLPWLNQFNSIPPKSAGVTYGGDRFLSPISIAKKPAQTRVESSAVPGDRQLSAKTPLAAAHELEAILGLDTIAPPAPTPPTKIARLQPPASPIAKPAQTRVESSAVPSDRQLSAKTPLAEDLDSQTLLGLDTIAPPAPTPPTKIARFQPPASPIAKPAQTRLE